MANKVVVDFETYCEAPIQDVGAWKYSQHPTLDVLCLSYAINDGPTKIWRQYRNDDLPYDLFDAIEDGFQVHAWNVSFEYSVWTNWCIKRGWPEVPIYSWFDTMAKAAAHGLPLGLMNCCIALGLPEEYHKQASGAEVLRKFSVPQKDGKRIYPHQIPNLEKVLYDYCVQDSVAERHIGKILAPLVPFEEDFWHIDFLINRRGIHVDSESSIKIRDKVIVEMAKANAKLPQLTGGLIDRISQTQRIVKFCQASGIKIPDCQASTVDRILDYVHANPDKVQEKHKPAIEILSTRKWYGKTATSKYDKIIECADDTDRVKFTMVYHGAHTGRWAGRLIQPHNFFKSTINKKCDIDAFVHAVSNRPVECVEAVYQPYIHAAASATRAMLQAPKDKIFYIGDYAAIEARIVFWLCGDDIGLGYYHKGLDPYCKMAEKIYGRVITKEENEHERFIGKGIVLGAGFGLSAGGFINTMKEQWGVAIDEQIAKDGIQAYRETHVAVVKGWNAVENCAISAVRNQGTTYTWRQLRFIKPVNRDFLYIFLPSGRYIAYPSPKIGPHKTPWGDIKQALSYKIWNNKWLRTSTYGGKIIENIVQGIARDVMAYGMVDCEFAGYPLTFTVHDELILELWLKYAKEAQLAIRNILQTPPPWAQGLPILIEDILSTRYRK